MTLIDTNVLRDVLGADPEWLPWSVDQLRQCRLVGQLLINDITYAELAVRVATEAALNAALAELGVRLERTPVPALFLAGKAFGRYRAAGGPRPSLPPDFFIGAHAQVGSLRLLTRDPRRYRTYFPGVELISPET
jgi:predicted nucleic acid-binding protein